MVACLLTLYYCSAAAGSGLGGGGGGGPGQGAGLLHACRCIKYIISVSLLCITRCYRSPGGLSSGKYYLLPVLLLYYTRAALLPDASAEYLLSFCTAAGSGLGGGGGPGQGAGLLDWADKALGQGFTTVTKSVKNLLSGQRQAPVAAALEALMEGKQVGEAQPGWLAARLE